MLGRRIGRGGQGVKGCDHRGPVRVDMVSFPCPTMRRLDAFVLVTVTLFLVCGRGAAQPAPGPDTPEDIVSELYRLISVTPGDTTDWEAVRELFIPEAVIVLRVSKDATQTFSLQGWIDDFIAFNERARVTERGFSEQIIRMETTVFRDIANVFVLYEASILDSPRPPTLGVDSIDLIRRDGRWWIVSIVNDLPTPEHPIPARLQD